MYGMGAWQGTSARPLPQEQDNGAMGTPGSEGGGPAPVQRQQGGGKPVDIYGIASAVAGHGAQANAQAVPQAGGAGNVTPGQAAGIVQDNSIAADAQQQQQTGKNVGTIMNILKMFA